MAQQESSSVPRDHRPDEVRYDAHRIEAKWSERWQQDDSLYAAERVHRLAGHHAGETTVGQHLLPARTGQPAGYSTGPQVNVTQCFGWHGAAVGDVGELVRR